MVCGQAMRYSCHNKQRFATLRPISDVNRKKHGSNILIRNDNNEWLYYCHDCICLAGVNVAKSPLDIRLEFINKCLNYYRKL